MLALLLRTEEKSDELVAVAVAVVDGVVAVVVDGVLACDTSDAEPACEVMFAACAELLAGLATAWVTAAAWLDAPSGVVVLGGAVKGASTEAAADEAVYPYMAPASWAHISMYWASVAAIAGVFCPKKLVAIRFISKTRFAAITGGGTVIAKAASKAAAAARAWLAVASARTAAALSQLTYGVTADTIDVDAGPTQGPPVSSESTEW
jgi:hypothetical protein